MNSKSLTNVGGLLYEVRGMLQRSWFTTMNRIIKFIIGSVTGIITAIICMMMEEALHNPDDMSFKVFRFIVFLYCLV